MSRKVILTREELYAMVWSEPLSQVAKRYGLSGYMLQKLCIRLSVPMPRARQVNKLKTGESIKIPQLAKDYSGEPSVTLTISPEAEAEGRHRKNVIADPLIVAARSTLLRHEKKWLHNGLACTESGQLDIRVAPANIDPACRFMNLLLQSLRVRGHTITFRNWMTYVLVWRQEMQIVFREKLTRVPDPTWQGHTKMIPTGILAFQVVYNFQQKEWTQGAGTWEEKIPTILDKLEADSRWLSAEDGKREKRWAEQAEQERIREEKRARREKERNDFAHLMQTASRWRQAAVLREYLDALESPIGITGDLPPERREWLEWGRAKADWYDPLTAGPDDWLTEEDKDQLETFKNLNRNR
jgi:hypothetical protein